MEAGYGAELDVQMTKDGQVVVFHDDDLKRGCTLYEVIGGYTNEKSIELEVLLTKDEFSKLLAYLKDNEIAAFTTAGNVSEVYGLWTKHSKKKALKSEAESR